MRPELTADSSAPAHPTRGRRTAPCPRREPDHDPLPRSLAASSASGGSWNRGGRQGGSQSCSRDGPPDGSSGGWPPSKARRRLTQLAHEHLLGYSPERARNASVGGRNEPRGAQLVGPSRPHHPSASRGKQVANPVRALAVQDRDGERAAPLAGHDRRAVQTAGAPATMADDRPGRERPGIHALDRIGDCAVEARNCPRKCQRHG